MRDRSRQEMEEILERDAEERAVQSPYLTSHHLTKVAGQQGAWQVHFHYSDGSTDSRPKGPELTFHSPWEHDEEDLEGERELARSSRDEAFYGEGFHFNPMHGVE